MFVATDPEAEPFVPPAVSSKMENTRADSEFFNAAFLTSTLVLRMS